MKLVQNEHSELRFTDKFSDDNSIHLVHCADNLEDIKEDVWEPYIVAEECTNFARIHLVTAPNEDVAAQDVAQYLQEAEHVSEPHIIAVFKLEI